MKGVKKTHWLRNTLIVLIACGVASMILAAVLFTSDSGRTSASAMIQFSFDGAAEGKGPDGYAFDLSGFTSDEVLDTALAESGLTGVYTTQQLRDNLTVTGNYPEKIVAQMTKYVSLLDENASSQAAVTDYRATEYFVTLYNDFDKSISSVKLTELVDRILAAYRAYFAKNNAPSLSTEENIADLAEYDYAQQLEAITMSNDQLIRYAEEMAGLAPAYMLNRKSFSDIAARYEGLKSDIDRLDATVTFNAISKDRERLKKRYEMEIRTQQYQLDSLTEELKLIEEQVNSYDKNGIVYVSSNGNLNKIGSDSTGTYDKLVEKRKKITDKISGINAKISLYQSRLDDMMGMAARAEVQTEEEDASAAKVLTEAERKQLQEGVEKKITALIEKKNDITAEFAAMMEGYKAQEVNERTVSATAAKYNTSKILSGAFILKVIKTAGPICAVGFMVCMVLLIISRRKEEKGQMNS